MMVDSSLETTEQTSAAVAVAPRVSLKDIENAILHRFDITLERAVGNAGLPAQPDVVEAMGRFSMCALYMKNGFMVIGVSAPASPENFNADVGKQYAYENAVRQLWPLLGYALRDKLSRD